MPLLPPIANILGKSMYEGAAGEGTVPNTVMELIKMLESQHDDLLIQADNALSELLQVKDSIRVNRHE